MNIVEIRAKLPNDVFSSWELNMVLADYRNKKAKTASLLRRGVILRLCHGLYVFAEPLLRAPLNICMLANRIYAPSYVSSDFALSYYGLIPEKTVTVTSISRGRTREFVNPVGRFRYHYCRSQAYPIGITSAGDEQGRFLIATPEKALFDKVSHDAGFTPECPERYLRDNLRLDLDRAAKFDKTVLTELAPYMTGRLRGLFDFLEKL